ncbi:MAG: hypothetical protein ACYSWZ_07325 [Planctomycetota bacterium]|jgi:hypothetical protein
MERILDIPSKAREISSAIFSTSGWCAGCGFLSLILKPRTNGAEAHAQLVRGKMGFS